MEEETIYYDIGLKDKWNDGAIQNIWKKKYKTFDEDDLRLSLSQPRYHLGEWITAIYYAKQGYRVLVEKYLYKNHSHKIKIISDILTPEDINFLKTPKPRCQAPDLFVFKDNKFFFVEVKRDKDYLSKRQINFFKNIEKELRCKVKIIHVLPIKMIKI